jgi:hypothetical protein
MDWKKIIKSRLKKKSKAPDWYQKRLDICRGCPLYFHNKKNKTWHDWKWYVLNWFNAQCTLCDCGIKYKAILPEEYCSLKDEGLEPKWTEEEEN